MKTRFITRLDTSRRLGLDRNAVMSAVSADLVPLASNIPFRSSYIGQVTVSGLRVEYRAFRVSDDVVNVGTIFGKN